MSQEAMTPGIAGREVLTGMQSPSGLARRRGGPQSWWEGSPAWWVVVQLSRQLPQVLSLYPKYKTPKRASKP